MAVLSLTLIVVFTIVAVGVGWPLAVRLDPRKVLSDLERGLVAFGGGALVFFFGVFAVGHIRLDRLSMAFLGFALAVAAIPGLRQVPWRDAWTAVASQLQAARRDIWLAVLWLAVLATGLSALLQGLAPPNDYDSLMYHLAVPQADVERGRIAPAWHLGMPHIFFPALLGNLIRFGLALVGEPVAQMFSAVFGIVAAAATGAIVRRLGFDVRTAILAGLMFLGIRAVVWEMATAEVDVTLAAYTGLAVITYLAWREDGGVGLMALFGFMLGGAVSTKYHGLMVALAFAVVMSVDLIREPRRFGSLSVGPIVTLATLLPHLLVTYSYTRNPIFPLLNPLINPGGPDFFADTLGQYGTGRSLLSLLRTPWDIFILPAHYFDGFTFGGPYLLAFLPFGVAVFIRRANSWPVLVITGVYFVLWFYAAAQQVRFLTPVFPLLSALAAGGATTLWGRVRHSAVLKAAYAGLAGILVVNQAMFVGIYGAVRLPPALGFVDAAAYHARTPTMQGAFYATCTYIKNNLKPGERYLSLLNMHSYYCPQTAAITGHAFDDETRYWQTGKSLPPIRLDAFVQRLEETGIRFIVVQHHYESRRNPTARPELRENPLIDSRFGRFITPAVNGLTPLASDGVSAVYDGTAVVTRLKAMLAEGRVPDTAIPSESIR